LDLAGDPGQPQKIAKSRGILFQGVCKPLCERLNSRRGGSLRVLARGQQLHVSSNPARNPDGNFRGPKGHAPGRVSGWSPMCSLTAACRRCDRRSAPAPCSGRHRGWGPEQPHHQRGRCGWRHGILPVRDPSPATCKKALFTGRSGPGPSGSMRARKGKDRRTLPHRGVSGHPPWRLHAAGPPRGPGRLRCRCGRCPARGRRRPCWQGLRRRAWRRCREPPGCRS
jgi:hypothetical protein